MPAAPPRRFAYYDRLPEKGKRTYRKSDAVGEVPLFDVPALRALVPPLQAALDGGDVVEVQRATARLAGAIVDDLRLPPVDIEVLEARPRGGYGELHGLYTYDDGQTPRIQVWMRTAARARVVAWKSFLRTLLHELGHHLDLNLLALDDTFHTQGFYRRENSLFRQLTGGAEPAPRAPKAEPPPAAPKSPPARKPRPAPSPQLKIPGF